MGPGALIADKYRILSVLGEGAMGVVWAARNERTEREVAIKLIHSGDADGLGRARLLREARACGRVAHRNVVEIYDVGETDEGEPFLVMQLLRGATLAARIASAGRLPWPEAARIGADIASGLAAAHDAGIVHRDLKPANVFLHAEAGAAEVVKIVDFGVSKLSAHTDAAATATGTAIGSPAYMSPEQARGDRDVDHRADLWALGVVLFEMIAGRRPFDGDTAYAVAAEILGGRIPRLDERVAGVDRELVALVRRCLQRDRGERIASASEAATVLATAASATRPTRPDVRVLPSGLEQEPTELLGDSAAPVGPPGGPAQAATVPVGRPAEAVPTERIEAQPSPVRDRPPPDVSITSTAPTVRAVDAPAAPQRPASSVERGASGSAARVGGARSILGAAVGVAAALVGGALFFAAYLRVARDQPERDAVVPVSAAPAQAADPPSAAADRLPAPSADVPPSEPAAASAAVAPPTVSAEPAAASASAPRARAAPAPRAPVRTTRGPRRSSIPLPGTPD